VVAISRREAWRFAGLRIARTYHTTARAISETNKLDDDSLDADARLVIPIAAGKFSDTGTYARRITRYHVRKGDTLETVAENFAVPAKMVRSWNRLKGNSVGGTKGALSAPASNSWNCGHSGGFESFQEVAEAHGEGCTCLNERYCCSAQGQAR